MAGGHDIVMSFIPANVSDVAGVDVWHDDGDEPPELHPAVGYVLIHCHHMYEDTTSRVEVAFLDGTEVVSWTETAERYGRDPDGWHHCRVVRQRVATPPEDDR